MEEPVMLKGQGEGCLLHVVAVEQEHLWIQPGRLLRPPRDGGRNKVTGGETK